MQFPRRGESLSGCYGLQDKETDYQWTEVFRQPPYTRGRKSVMTRDWGGGGFTPSFLLSVQYYSTHSDGVATPLRHQVIRRTTLEFFIDSEELKIGELEVGYVLGVSGGWVEVCEHSHFCHRLQNGVFPHPMLKWDTKSLDKESLGRSILGCTGVPRLLSRVFTRTNRARQLLPVSYERLLSWRTWSCNVCLFSCTLTVIVLYYQFQFHSMNIEIVVQV